MNAVEFLGKEKINSLISQGFSPMQIRDFAKNEYYKPNPNLAQPNLRNDTQTSSDNQQFYQAPSAPSLENRVIQSDKSLADKAIDSLKGLKKEAGAFVENLRTGGDAFRSKDDLMKTQVARIQNDGGLLQTITRSKEQTAENLRKNKSDLDNIAKSHGFNLGALIDDDGKVYFGNKNSDGEITEQEVTPSFLNNIGAYRNEAILALLAGLGTGGTGFLPALGASGVGAMSGAGLDYKNRADLTQENETAGDYLKRMAWAGADDLAGGLLVGGAIKGGKALINHAPSLNNAVSGVGETAEKIYDNLPISSVVRQFGTDNIGGATDKAIKNLGGETEYLSSLNQAKEALGDKAFSEFANERVIQIPRTKFETINKGVDFVNEKLVKPFNESVKKVVAQSDLNEQEANLFLANLAHENGAKIITNSVAHDPQAYGKAVQMFKKLNGTTKQTLDEALKNSPSVIKVFDDFEKRTKADFGAVMDTLNEFFSKNAPQSTELIKSNKRRILTNARQIFGDSDELSKFTGTLKKPTNLNEWQDLRNLIGNEIGSIERNGKKFGLNSQDNATLRLLRTIRNDIDSSIDDIFNQFEKTHPNLGERAKELINTARKDYHAYKNMEHSDLYHAISTGIKDEAKITDILIKSVNNENGADLNAFLSVLGNKERANAENAIIRAVLEKNTAENITDFKAVLDTLNELPLQSEKATSILNHLNTNAPILKNTGEILNDLKNINPKGYELSQGISHSIKARIKTMIANRITNKLKSKAPLGFGDNQALQNHINNAIKGSGNLEIALKNIAEIPTENLPSNARVALEAFKKDFANFSAEIKAEVKQDIKQTLKEMSDNGEIDILEMARNIKPKQADQVAENLVQNETKQAENVGKFGDEVDILAMARERNANAVKEPIKGNGFTMSKDGKITFLDEAKFELNQELRNKTGLQDKITTSLAWLQNKHPEMFANKRAVKEVIDYVLNEPQIIKPAKSENSVFMGKMDNEKIKDIVVNKDENKIIHATHRKPSKAEKADSGNALPPHSDTMSDGALKLADKQRLSAFNDDIIPQFDKFKNKKGVEVIDEADIIKIQAKTPTGDIQEFIYFKDDGKFLNRTIDQDKTRILHSGDFEIKSIDDLENAINKSLGENVKSSKEILDEIDRLHAENNAKFDLIKKETNEAKKEQLSSEFKANLDKVKELESGYFNAKMEHINSVNGNFLNELKAIKKDKLLNADQQTEAIIKTHQQAVKYFDENGLNLKNLHEFNKLYDEIDFIASRKRYDIQKLYNEVEKKYNIPNLSHSETERAKFYKIPQTQNGKYMHEIRANERLGKSWIVLKAHAYGDNIWSKKDLIKRYTNSRHSVNEATEKVEKLLNDLRNEIQAEFKITPLPQHGTNYAEFYHDGIGAFNKIKAEKSGQVSGAFHRSDLGDIDLVWGAIKDQNGKVVGYGLSKILVKHKEITDKLLDEIVSKGELITENGVNTIWLKKGDDYYLAGLSKGWNGSGENKWIVTAYEKTSGKIPEKLKNVVGNSENLSANAKFDGLQTSNPTNKGGTANSARTSDFTQEINNTSSNPTDTIIPKNSENVNLQKEILDETKTAVKTQTVADELANAKDYNAKFEIIKREINKKARAD